MDCSDLEAQGRFYADRWDTPQWRMIFRVFFNRFILARRGLDAAYFRFDDGSGSFAESFLRRARHAMTAIPIRGNYFLHQYVLGGYRSPEETPDYLREANYATIRDRLDRIEVVTADVKEWLAGRPAGSMDGFALSNICEMMDQADTARTFSQVLRVARPGARACFRNLMVPRSVPADLADRIVVDGDLSRSIRLADRSFVYSRVDALRINA
jgi:S-adenosylmethionine-diacylglycerol 3-amino-3-carboxypropyl transferase